MKKAIILTPIIIILLCSIILLTRNKNELTPEVYLKLMLSKLEQIESATYFTSNSATAPGDTSRMLFKGIKGFVKEYANLGDPFIGSTFAYFEYNDTTRMTYFYDGDSRCRLNWDVKTFEVDSFQNNSLPFRPISPPFFKLAEKIARYALETEDSIKTETIDFGDSILLTLTIYDEVVEFFGQPVHMDENYFKHNPDVERISIYDLWINKRDNLPYRLKRHQPHNISWISTSDVVLNNNYPVEFRGTAYIPPDFKNRKEIKREVPVMELEGVQAPDWVLLDFNNNSFSLGDFKRKVLMLKFTGIGCGPCKAAIPFLKELTESYDVNDFELVGIETWIDDNLSALKNYAHNNELNYKFLNATQDITQSYRVRGVPVFFILDGNRVIRKIISGYSRDTTDNDIINAINDLI